MTSFRRDNVSHPTPTQLHARHHCPSNTTQSHSSKIMIPAAQMINYDVLSAIFVLSCAKLETSPVKLASVCRHWRQVALVTPRIWTKISSYTSKHPKYGEMFLNRSKNLPLDITISEDTREWQVKDLAASRISSLTIADRYRYLVGYFPLLERLELVAKSHATDVEQLRAISFSLMERFPKLRELCILHVSYPISMWAANSQSCGFPPLQKLEIGCRDYWEIIVDNLSKSLVSLHLSLVSFGWSDVAELTLQQLRYLRITEPAHSKQGSLKIDAPRLESLEDRRGWEKPPCTTLQLCHLKSIKHFFTCDLPLHPIPYPSLTTLWIRLGPRLNGEFRSDLAMDLQRCCDVTHIMYHDSSPDWTKKILLGDPRSIIQQIAGENVTVESFDLSEMNLPGSLL